MLHFYGNAVRGYIDTRSVFYWWAYQWWNPSSETEHGWLILGLSAWLLWRNLRTPGDRGLANRDQRPDAPGDDQATRNPKPETQNLAVPAVAMVGALALHALGFAAQQTRISILALLLFTWGVLRLGGGRRWGAAAAFPLAFMVFAIPVNVLDSLGFWLRLGVVDASAAIARTAGIPVVQSGTQLFAPDGRYNYDVAAACSGVRSLTAMVALSLLAGYLNFRGPLRRGLALLLSVPLVYAGNVARIVAIVFAAQAGGPRWGNLAHEAMGYGVFVIVLGGVLVAIALIRRYAPEGRDQGLETGGPLERSQARDDLAGGRYWGKARQGCHLINDRRASFVVAGLVAGLAGAEILFLHQLQASPARGGEVGVALAPGGRDPVELPAFLGTDWIGRRTDVSAVEREILPPDTGYSRKLYVPVSDPRRHVLLSIVLTGRDRSSIHRPELCLVGQGWTITAAGGHRFRVSGRSGDGFPATLLRVKREVVTPRGNLTVPQLTAYWFIGANEVVATHWQRIMRDAWNRVAHARADRWAYVLMQTDASDGEAAALARMQAVLDQTLPVFTPQVFALQKPKF